MLTTVNEHVDDVVIYVDLYGMDFSGQTGSRISPFSLQHFNMVNIGNKEMGQTSCGSDTVLALQDL